MDLVIKTARELMALEPPGRRATRRAARTSALMQRVLRMFATRGGPIPVEYIGVPLDALMALDADDLLRVQHGHVDVAYPFIARPTPWVVTLPGGQERYACCATDALGIAPMLGHPIHIRSSCHHCGTPLQFQVTLDGPAAEAHDVMVWFGTRVDDRCKVVDTWWTTINFFRSEDHLRTWREANPELDGAGATMRESYTFAALTFGGLLVD